MMDQRKSNRISMETDCTLKDIWKFSQRASASFDPQGVNHDVESRRQVRQAIGAGAKLPFSEFKEGDSPLVRPEEMSRAMRRRSAGLNLHKSIQLLDEAVATPAHSSSRHTPGRQPYTSNYSPHNFESGSMYDLSASLGLGTPAPHSFNLTTQGTLGDKTSIGSLSVAPSIAASDMTMMDDIPDMTTTNVGLLLEEDPGLSACTGLYESFSVCSRSHLDNGQLLAMLQGYESICQEHAQILKKLVKRTVPGQDKFKKTVAMLNNLTEEQYTWRLLASLFEDEQNFRPDKELAMVTEEQVRKTCSEKALVETLYEEDSSVRQAQLVLDWLESNAQDELEDYYDRVEYYTDKMGAWENSLHKLKQRNPMATDNSMVNRLDPDAPRRQKRPLAHLDTEDEDRLAKYIFVCIRAGNLHKAQALCKEIGHSYKAATLEGWRLFDDPNLTEGLGAGGMRQSVEGNPNRDLWKAVCWRIAEDERLPLHQRAIYAAVSGNVRPLLSYCFTWRDHLWAYLRVLIDQHVEDHLKIHYSGLRVRRKLPDSYMEKRLVMEGIFQELESSSQEEVRRESHSRFHVLQKYIILNDIESLMEEVCEWARDESRPMSSHLLRCLAHLALFYRAKGAFHKEEQCTVILQAYVSQLVQGEHSPLIAMYVAQLPPQHQLPVFTNFLKGVTGSEERRRCVQWGLEAGLDVPRATKLVVEMICNSQPTSIAGDHNVTADPSCSVLDDKMKIEAIEWLTFDPNQRADALKQANSIVRNFLLAKKLEACRQVLEKLPSDTVAMVAHNAQEQTGDTELNADDDNATKEYLCVRVYLEAQDSFNEWFAHYHGNRPTAPAALSGGGYMEKVAHEHQMRDYEAEKGRWLRTLQQHTEVTEKKIYNVLLFPRGGWMTDSRTEGTRDGNRTHQLRVIRQRCLPPLCTLLHTVLHSTERYGDCLRMADVIAAEEHQLYKAFGKDEIQQLLTKMRDSSIEMLHCSKDPLGYDLA